jgi:hypothetical protein
MNAEEHVGRVIATHDKKTGRQLRIRSNNPEFIKAILDDQKRNEHFYNIFTATCPLCGKEKTKTEAFLVCDKCSNGRRIGTKYKTNKEIRIYVNDRWRSFYTRGKDVIDENGQKVGSVRRKKEPNIGL